MTKFRFVVSYPGEDADDEPHVLIDMALVNMPMPDMHISDDGTLYIGAYPGIKFTKVLLELRADE